MRVSRLLGHASPTITLNVYSHMLHKEHYGSTERLATLIFRNKVETSAQKPPKRATKPRKKKLQIPGLGMVARDGIDPSTRGFSDAFADFGLQ